MSERNIDARQDSVHEQSLKSDSSLESSNAASLSTRVLNQGRYEALMMLRNGEQLLLAIILPLLAMIGLVITPLIDGIADTRINAVAPGVLALCVVSTAFTGQGITTGFDRRYGVLRFLATTPLGKAGLISGKAIAVLLVVAIQVIILGSAALLMGWQPFAHGQPLAVTASAIVFVLLGVAAFTALGLLIAGTVRPEATLAITNLAWVLLASVGGLLLPAHHVGGIWGPLLSFLPSAALGDGLRSAFLDGQFNVMAAVSLLIWAALATFGASRWFKWD